MVLEHTNTKLKAKLDLTPQIERIACIFRYLDLYIRIQPTRTLNLFLQLMERVEKFLERKCPRHDFFVF